MPYIVVVWDRDGWTVAYDVPELAPEKQPGGGMITMIVTLVPGKKQQGSMSPARMCAGQLRATSGFLRI